MDAISQPFVFEQIHIEVARNATDDFNLFHDKMKWQCIRNNPFAGPIVLGFQLEALIEQKVEIFRSTQGERDIIDQYNLRFSNYEFTFASAIKPGCSASIEIKPPRLKQCANTTLSRRVCIKTAEGIALIGYKRESQLPLYLTEPDLPLWADIKCAADRSYLRNTPFFLKKKFMNTSNAKNFLTGSLVEQTNYFDELEDIAHFPEMFPCSLISCALLERAKYDGHDFKQNPMVYTTHKICIDRHQLSELKSNDALYILIGTRHSESVKRSPSQTSSHHYECYGLLRDGRVLFRASIDLMPLDEIINRNTSSA